ncbi:hypothetical protein [Azospirillum sp. sgz302134]
MQQQTVSQYGCRVSGAAAIHAAPAPSAWALRQELAALVERYAATLDDAEVRRLVVTADRAPLAPIVALAEELMIQAEYRQHGGWMVAFRRLAALGG